MLAIHGRAEILLNFPEIGYRYRERPEVRVLLYGHYRIAYLVMRCGRAVVSSVCEASRLSDSLKDQVFRIGAAVGAGSDVLSGVGPPTGAIEARWQMGKDRPTDVVWSSAANAVLLSERTCAALTRAGCTGWHGWPVRLIGKRGEVIDGYSALAVTGRVGPADYSLARVVWRDFPGGRYAYLKGCCFDQASWDGSDVFMERPQPELGQSLSIYVSARGAAALRNARIKNVSLEPLRDEEVSAMIFNERQRAHWPSELRKQVEAGGGTS